MSAKTSKVTTRKPDRRPERTRAQLHHALLALVMERGYADVTVQDILDRANVGRSTFYAHFKDKDELLLSGMEPLRDALMQIVTARGGADGPDAYLSFVPAFFEHAAVYRGPFAALAGPARSIAEEQIASTLEDLIREDIRRGARVRGASTRIDAASHAIAAGMMGLMSWWIAQKAPIAAADVTALALEMFRPAARQIAAPAAPLRDRLPEYEKDRRNE